MLHLEVEVMLIGIGSETNLFHHRLGRFRLGFLLLLLLFVQELLVIYNPAYRGITVGNNFNQVQLFLFRNTPRFFERIDVRLDVLSNQPDFGSGNIFIDIVLVFSYLVPVWPERSATTRRATTGPLKEC
jgi:hypothetical protein